MSRKHVAIICIASLAFAQACATEDASRTPMTGAEIADDAGMGLGSFIATAFYTPVKLVYATGGLIAGGLAWVFSGGDSEVAMGVIEPAVSGDYILTPDLLRSPDSLEFIGRGNSATASRIAATPAKSSSTPAVSAPPPGSRASTKAASQAAGKELDSVKVSDVLASCSGTVNLQPIRFAYESRELDAEAQRRLQNVPAALARCPGSTVQIAGHTDATGPSPYNMELSKQRAMAIRDHLIAQGVEASRLKVVAEGEAKPASSNETRAGRASNRRAEVALVVH